MQHYRGTDNKLRLAYRVYQHFSDEDIDMLRDLNENRDLAVEDPWSLNKLTSTHFLNSDPDIRRECMHANAKDELASDVDVSKFCASRMVDRLLEEILQRKKLAAELVTEEIREMVNVITPLQCYLYTFH